MRKTGLKLIFLAAALVAIGTAGLAAQTPSPYPLGYWVFGKVAKAADGKPDNLAGYKVVVYGVSGKPTQAYASGLTDVNGNFQINLYNDLRLKPTPGPNFYVGIVKKDGYGLNEKAQLLGIEGYTDLGSLALQVGQGIDDPDVAVAASGLTAARESDVKGSSLVITWDKTKFGGVNPMIYALKGDGTGQYQNTYDAEKWQLVFNGTSTVNPSGFGSFILGTGDSIKHAEQVGQGLLEVYYKAYAGTNPASDPTGFQSAPAVGKFDIGVTPGNNLVSSPFVTETLDLDKMVGSQLTAGADPNVADKIYTYKLDKTGFDVAWAKTGTAQGNYDGWFDPQFVSLTSSGIALNADNGFWIDIHKDHSEKTITVVGSVNLIDSTMVLTTGPNLVGSKYPKPSAVGALGLIGTMTAAPDPNNACRLWSFKTDKSGFDVAYLQANEPSGVWINTLPTGDPPQYGPTMIVFQPGHGYFIDEPTPDFRSTWTYQKPY